MRAAVIADIHANIWALDAVFADIDRRGIATIVNLGDSLAGPLAPVETAERLLPRGLLTISGNNDRDVLSDDAAPESSAGFARQRLASHHLDWLRALPLTATYLGAFFLCHGTPTSDRTYLLEDVRETGVFLRESEGIEAEIAGVAQPIILCGHSHISRVVWLPGGKLVVNPGSVGVPAYADDAPFPHRMEAGAPHARYAILTEQREGWAVEQVAVPYPWEEAAAVARANHRPDYARPLLTGRV